ncbi:hypothetical protein [Streptomyces californicus]|uniref:hypothetical protein n=1 Tax=Streptomyces californicus TaxID=67351 RepID=UPI0004BFFF1E|nr:hypothetical protein [Streptomyces californicus]QRV56624.1 hypothetical protein I6J40_22315 [Streptomyces californicus]
MAITPKKEGTESSVLQDKPAPAAAEKGDHDRIVMASRRADGSMDQTRPEFIGDKDVAIAAAKEQLAQQAASAVDVAARGVSSTPEGEGSSEPDPDVAALKAAQDQAIETAEAQAEREVRDLHKGLGD